MTRREGNILIIGSEGKSVCEMCKKEAETRPYGLNGANVCFECGMLNPQVAEAAFDKVLEGVEETRVDLSSYQSQRRK